MENAMRMQVLIMVSCSGNVMTKTAVSRSNRNLVLFLKKTCSFSVNGLFLSSIGANIKIIITFIITPIQQIIAFTGKALIANSIAVIRRTEIK